MTGYTNRCAFKPSQLRQTLWPAFYAPSHLPDPSRIAVAARLRNLLRPRQRPRVRDYSFDVYITLLRFSFSLCCTAASHIGVELAANADPLCSPHSADDAWSFSDLVCFLVVSSTVDIRTQGEASMYMPVHWGHGVGPISRPAIKITASNLPRQLCLVNRRVSRIKHNQMDRNRTVKTN